MPNLTIFFNRQRENPTNQDPLRYRRDDTKIHRDDISKKDMKKNIEEKIVDVDRFRSIQKTLNFMLVTSNDVIEQ